MLEPLPEADAIVSTSFFKNVTLAVPPTAGPLPPPWRYDDHYGFSSLSCIE